MGAAVNKGFNTEMAQYPTDKPYSDSMQVEDIRELMQILGNRGTASQRIVVLLGTNKELQSHINNYLEQQSEDQIDFENVNNIEEALLLRNISSDKLLDIVQTLSTKGLSSLEYRHTNTYATQKK